MNNFIYRVKIMNKRDIKYRSDRVHGLQKIQKDTLHMTHIFLRCLIYCIFVNCIVIIERGRCQILCLRLLATIIAEIRNIVVLKNKRGWFLFVVLYSAKIVLEQSALCC